MRRTDPGERLSARGSEDGGLRLRFSCDGCGEDVYDGDDCLILRVSRDGAAGCGEAFRLCGDCAEDRDTLTAHLDLLGVRYFCGPAEEAEGWEALGR